MAKRSGLVVGVDVGTGSVRAGVFNLQGQSLGFAEQSIKEWNPRVGVYEQSSSNIWSAAGLVVQNALQASGANPDRVIGISFDATCSLVVLGENDQALSVEEDIEGQGGETRDVIVWRCHRALEQAERINNGPHKMLKYLGGVVSPEHEVPKLLWLKENKSDTWQKAQRILDLADFMTYKCTGIDCRSLCTSVCKWGYVGHEKRWDRDTFDALSLEDVITRGLVPDDVRPMGESIGPLTAEAAKHVGLSTNVAVGVGIIDAHSGALGVAVDTSNLALISGTSACHMICSVDPIFVPGVWGPYFGAQREGEWLSEGGISACGALMDHVVKRYGYLCEEGKEGHVLQSKTMTEVYIELNEWLRAHDKTCDFAADIHMSPEFHGNRSPYADPEAMGTIDGLTLDMSYSTLAKMYLATVQSVAYTTRHIVEAMVANGHSIRSISACGGLTKNRLWVQEHADALQLPIRLPAETESVVLGSAILAAVAAGAYDSIAEASRSMCELGEIVAPRTDTKDFHDWKSQVQKGMYDQHLQRRMRTESILKTSSGSVIQEATRGYVWFTPHSTFGGLSTEPPLSVGSRTFETMEEALQYADGRTDDLFSLCCYLVLHKFGSEKHRKTLMDTGDRTLVYCKEGDLKWGIGLAISEFGRYRRTCWKGENLMGKSLMAVRGELNGNGKCLLESKTQQMASLFT